MKNISLCELKIKELREIITSFNLKDGEFTQSREYAERYTSVRDKNDNSIMVVNDNYSAHFWIYYPEGRKAEPLIEVLKSTYPLNFSYYKEVVDKAAAIYEINHFFEKPFKVPFAADTWDQFKMSPRKRIYSEEFSEDLKLRHTSAGKHDSNMKLKHRLSLAKLELPNGRYEYVPVIRFNLPVSRTSSRTIVISATEKYEFMFYYHNHEMVYVDRNEHEMFFAKLSKSIVTHVYNSLSNYIGMNDVALKEFKQLDDAEREQFVMISKMLKV